MAAEFWIKQNDDLPRVDATLTDGNDVPIDIEQADVFFTLRKIDADDPIIELAPAVNDQVGDGTDGTMGWVHYDWQPGDTDEPGGYRSEWQIEFVLGGTMTVPNNGWDLIAIMPALEPTGSS